MERIPATKRRLSHLDFVNIIMEKSLDIKEIETLLEEADYGPETGHMLVGSDTWAEAVRFLLNRVEHLKAGNRAALDYKRIKELEAALRELPNVVVFDPAPGWRRYQEWATKHDALMAALQGGQK